MAIGSILLHLDAAPACIGRLTLAHDLADRFDAQVTVLFGIDVDAVQPASAYSAAAALRAAEASEGPHEIERARLQAAHRERDGEAIWCDVGRNLVPALVAEAAYADLLILGPPTGAGEGGGMSGTVAAAVLRTGTPALVVPFVHRQETTGERILIAWDGSLHAARAARAALPFLRGAAEVHVATWARQPPFAPFSRTGLGDWLKRHGVDSRSHLGGATARVGEALCTLAGKLAADLIVMGCYGHGPLRERMFGGATRSLLTSLPAPVLMAH